MNLHAKLVDAMSEKDKLTGTISEYTIKLTRAKDLTTGLSNEKIRWANRVDHLEKAIESFLGDMLMVVGTVSYFGPLSPEFRARIIDEKWKPAIMQAAIPCSLDFSLVKALGDPLKIQEWTINGLPFDELSQENIIIMQYSKKYIQLQSSLLWSSYIQWALK